MLLLDYQSMEKQNGKKDFVRLVSSSNFEIIFILLTKIITVQMQIIITKIGELNFKKPFTKYIALMLFQQFYSSCVRLYELLIQFINKTYSIDESKGLSQSKNKNLSWCRNRSLSPKNKGSKSMTTFDKSLSKKLIFSSRKNFVVKVMTSTSFGYLLAKQFDFKSKL